MRVDFVSRVRSNPDFTTLVAERGRFGWTLAIIMVAIYFSFILCVAFAPGVMSIQLGRGLTLGFPLGIAVILSAIVLTGIYVVRANGEFDDLTRRIVADAQ